MYTREKEIRKLTSIQLYELAQILDLNDSWRKLMRIIPKNPFSDSPQDIQTYKYNSDHERLIENASKNQNRMAAEILFEEWGTSGRVRPTLGVLLELLARAHLFRAADLVAIRYLNEPPPARPSQGPAARIDISIPLDTEFVQGVEDMLENADSLGTNTLNDNADPSRLADNNIDYYEKYTPNVKRLSIIPQTKSSNELNPSSTNDNNNKVEASIQHSDLMKFSSKTITASEEDIPMLSVFNQTNTASAESNNSSDTINADQMSSVSGDLPILSALVQNTSTSKHIPNDNRLSISNNTIVRDNSSSSSAVDKNNENIAPKQPSELMKFSSTSVTEAHDNIPMLSELNQSTSDHQKLTSSVSLDLPNLSAFNAQSSLGDIIPNLSTLNVHDTSQPGSSDKTNSKALHDLSPSRQSLSSGDSTISSTSDDDDISAPNLSMLDQRSSNNDSSLTNVTATSEENSFEISLNERSTSFDNIPCLSALK
ncbi:protein Tube [Eupeodes corollae]|uniref:protein Tube n=1 Tax=Eupeodes corollae TaxID=290404 RepID=UPI00248F7117|nr:protein Tube [Eupeodes corollae]